jgi:predicted esterase
MQHHKIKVTKTAHIYTSGETSEQTKYFWFVAHGYGQLASRIIRKFEGFDPTEHFVVAPEALNRFYWNFKMNEVGANWMTKQDRSDDIADYAQYLQTVFDSYKTQLPASVRIILFGFSQGCATQVRWLLSGENFGFPAFHHLILWGGILPEDIDYQPFLPYFENKKLHFVCGDADEFIDQKRLDWHLDFAKAQGLLLRYLPFVGKHEVLVDVLEKLFLTEIKI